MHVSECLHVSENHVLQFSLITSSKRKQKISEHFVDIAKHTACEKIQIKDPNFCKSLSKMVYIIFNCRTSIIT